MDFLGRSLSFTWAGVDLFFVLSGFLISGILLDHFFDSRNFFVVFYARRTCRIWPFYLLMLGAYGLFVYLQPAAAPEWLDSLLDRNKPPWWSYMLFVQNLYFAKAGMGPKFLDVTWSLAVEEQFYLLFPLAFLAIGARRIAYLPFLLIGSAIALRWMLSGSEIGWSASYLLLPTRWDSLGFGMLVALIVRDAQLLGLAKRHERWLMAMAVVAAVYCVTTHIFRNQYDQPWGLQLFGYSVIAAGAAALVLHVVTDPQSRITRLLSLRWLRQLGQVSFALYLLHKPVLWITIGLVLGQRPELLSVADAALTIVSLAIAVFLSWCSWWLWESRWQTLGHRLRYR